MRNVVITTDGNPFAINLWYKNFKKWSDEIDLYKILKTRYDINGGYFPSMLFFNINLFQKIKSDYNFFYDNNLNKIKSDGRDVALYSATYNENTIFTFLNNYKLERNFSDEITNIFGILLKLNSKKRLDVPWLTNRHHIDFNKKYENWIHIGSVGGTSGIYGSLRKKNKVPIFETIDKLPLLENMFVDCYQENVKPEWERRMGYFLATHELWNNTDLISLKEEYLFAIYNFSNTFNLSWNNICKYKENILVNI